MIDNSKDTLHLGICLAGAVSAGAYTAGVIDFLLEALEEWENKRGQDGIPQHKVVITAIGGASAGGMTGIVTAAAINNIINPVRELRGDILEPKPANKLYHTWVDMTESDMFSRLLRTDDIKNKVPSLLNSKFIDDIARRVVEVDKNNKVDKPYIDDHLKIFTTLTNLKGLHYDTNFNSGSAGVAYHFSKHGDYATFELNSAPYNSDGWIPLDFFKDLNVKVAQEAAMATGAFPVGLTARGFSRKSIWINDLEWNKDITENWPVPQGDDRTLCVDGGIINNEPFQKVKALIKSVVKLKALKDGQIDQNQEVKITNTDTFMNQSVADFDSSLIMIDPFPSEKPSEFDPDNSDVFDAIGKTFSAILSQIRLKPEILQNVYDDKKPFLNLIAPVRYENDTKIYGSKAIACGFLGGFGGFLHKEFRIHDFFLGRANCEKFLRDYYKVPEDSQNPIFANGYRNVNLEEHRCKGGGIQIIPIFKKESPSPYIPQFESGKDWPVRSQNDITKYYKPMKNRVNKILKSAVKLPWYLRPFKFILNKKLANAALGQVISQMRSWKLLAHSS